jgi:predicted DNA-binding ribbon-helix-helix protein
VVYVAPREVVGAYTFLISVKAARGHAPRLFFRSEDDEFSSAAEGVRKTMNTVNIKRSIVRNGQKTSVSLENEFWEALREIANAQDKKLTALVQEIDQKRNGTNLSSAIRVFVFNHLRAQVAAARDDRSPAQRPKVSNLGC